MNPAQNGFALADKLHFFYTYGPKDGRGINTVLFEHLGQEKYKQFCQQIQTVPLRKGIRYPQYFSEAFLRNPVREDNIVSDETVRRQWQLSSFMTTVQKVL